MRHALRGLRRSPRVAWIAIASSALGIGANTAIFSFVDASLMQRLPAPEPERLVTFVQTHRGERTGLVWPLRTIDALDQRTPAFAGSFGWFARPVSLSTDDDRWINGELVTGRYYRVLAIRPAIGRLRTTTTCTTQAPTRSAFSATGSGSARSAATPALSDGRTVLLNGHDYPVVGMTARGFHGAELHQRFGVGVPATRIGDFMSAFDGATGIRVGVAPEASTVRDRSRRSGGIRTEIEHGIDHEQARCFMQAVD